MKSDLDQLPLSNEDGRIGVSFDEAKRVARAIGLVGISLLLCICVLLIAFKILEEAPLFYLIAPFIIVFLLSLGWLTRLLYSWALAAVVALSVIFPLIALVMLFLCYKKGFKLLKENGYKASFIGSLKKM